MEKTPLYKGAKKHRLIAAACGGGPLWPGARWPSPGLERGVQRCQCLLSVGSVYDPALGYSLRSVRFSCRHCSSQTHTSADGLLCDFDRLTLVALFLCIWMHLTLLWVSPFLILGSTLPSVSGQVVSLTHSYWPTDPQCGAPGQASDSHTVLPRASFLVSDFVSAALVSDLREF